MPAASAPMRAVVLLGLATALGGCLIDRSALGGPPDRDGDAGHVEGIDAPTTPEPDAGPDVDRDGGSVEPDAYVAPEPDTGAISSCDEAGEACCSGRCAAGLECTAASICDVPGCGAAGAACCSAGVCYGTNTCTSGRCAHCGASGESCCVDRTCESSLGCGGDGRCGPCGMVGQPCCAGSCLGGECDGGTCRAPAGTRGGPCRGLGECDAWAQCNFSGICEPCGMRGETCCGTGSCAPSLSCNYLGGFRCE